MPKANTLIALCLGLAVTFSMVFLRNVDPPLIATMRGAGFDTLQSIWPRSSEPAQPIRIVDIDEASLKTIGQWPWPRDELARLVAKLTEFGAAAISFDILFPEPDRLSTNAARSNDQAFADAIAAGPVVTAFASTDGAVSQPPQSKAGFAQTGSSPELAPLRLAHVVSNLPILDAGAKGLGSMNIDLAGDQGIARQVPLLWSDGKQFYPSLILESLRVAQHVESYVVNGSETREGTIDSIRVGDIEIPTSESGMLHVNYRPDNPALYISAREVLRGDNSEKLRPLIEGNIILIGTSAVGLLDIRTSVLGEGIPGVSVHAQALEQILAGKFLSRPDWVVGAEYLATVLSSLLLAALSIRYRPHVTIGVMVLALGALAGVTALSFRDHGLLVDFTFPAATLLLTFISTTAYKLLVTDRQGRHLRRSFAHYVAPSVLAEIERNPQDLKLGGEIRDVTVMFVDIKNFTPLSEKLPPQELVNIINGVLDACSQAILAEGGTIDKYIGDAVMAFWNAPVATADHQYHALCAALKIHQNLENYNDSEPARSILQSVESWPVAVRIGMASGPACIGNMGSAERFNYTVLGDAVNTAARAENACKTLGHDCLLAGAVEGRSFNLAIISAGEVPLKGKAKDTPVHAVMGDERVAASTHFHDFKQRYAMNQVALADFSKHT